MKKIFLKLLTIFIILLDWAALHDIIKGNEPNYFGEYSVIILSVLYFAALVYFWLKNKAKASAA